MMTPHIVLGEGEHPRSVVSVKVPLFSCRQALLQGLSLATPAVNPSQFSVFFHDRDVA